MGLEGTGLESPAPGWLGRGVREAKHRDRRLYDSVCMKCPEEANRSVEKESRSAVARDWDRREMGSDC